MKCPSILARLAAAVLALGFGTEAFANTFRAPRVVSLSIHTPASRLSAALPSYRLSSYRPRLLTPELDLAGARRMVVVPTSPLLIAPSVSQRFTVLNNLAVRIHSGEAKYMFDAASSRGSNAGGSSSGSSEVPVLDGASSSDLVEIIKKLPKGLERDDVIASVPAETYEKMQGSDVAKLLKLVHWPGTYQTYAPAIGKSSIPRAAWERLGKPELESVLRQWSGVRHTYNLTFTEDNVFAMIIRSWIAANRITFKGEGVSQIVGMIPGGMQRDAVIATIPAIAFERIPQSEVGKILALVWSPAVYKKRKSDSYFKSLPDWMWKHVDAQAIKVILDRWTGVNFNPRYPESRIKKLILERWMEAHRAE